MVAFIRCFFRAKTQSSWRARSNSRPLGLFDRSEAWTQKQRARARAGYRRLAAYVRRMHEAGVRLSVGTDWLDPGRVVQSETQLLHRAGIPMPDVIRIATLGGAEAIGREAEFGAIEPGLKANLVLFARDPLADAGALGKDLAVIKDGKVWARNS